MAWTITWKEFVTYASEIVTVSEKFEDGWAWIGNKDLPGSAYIAKKVTRSVLNVQQDDVDLEDTSLINEKASFSLSKYCGKVWAEEPMIHSYNKDGKLSHSNANPLVTWLSSVGPVVGIELPIYYGLLVTTHKVQQIKIEMCTS